MSLWPPAPSGIGSAVSVTALGDVALGQIYLEAELGGAEVLATVAPLGAALVGSLTLVSQPASQASPGHSYGSLSA